MSNQDYNIKKILSRFKNKNSIDQDTLLRVNLDNKSNLVKPDKNIFVLNAIDQFNLERNGSGCYRINGKLEIITDNSLYATYCNTPVNTDWSPEVLDNGSDNYGGKKIPKNWTLQITYPSESNDREFIRTSVNGVNQNSRAYFGVQVEKISEIIINGRSRVLMRTVQKHGVSEIGEYVYYSNRQNLGYLGFHRVIDFEIGNEERGLILETPYSIDLEKGNIKRVFEPSLDDANFNVTTQISQIERTDENGQTIGPLDFIKIYHDNHDLRIGDWVDLRLLSAPANETGLHRVVGIPSKDEFLIPAVDTVLLGVLDTTNLDLYYRPINGVPSEYYVRKFKVLTELVDYEVYNAGFSSNVFSDGVSNNISLFHFNRDINVNGLIDNLNRPLSELYLTVTKRSSYVNGDEMGYRSWSPVISTWEENKTFLPMDPATTLFRVEWINGEVINSFDNKTTGFMAKPNSGDTYFGDFVEYNSSFLEEKVLSKIINRFSPLRFDGVPGVPLEIRDYSGEGYYYLPHNKIQIREFSDVIETTPNRSDEIFPEWAQINNDGTVSWRDLLDIGFFEGGTKGVDYPFVNGCNYLFDSYAIYIRRQRPILTTDVTLEGTKFVQIDPNKLNTKGLGNEC